MMELLSPVHGKISYSNKEIITFKKGIPGFDGLNKYVVKDIEDSPFKLLQSIEDVQIGFVLISPFDVEEKYEIKLNDDMVKKLDVKEPTDVALYSIVTLSSKIENITANLKAPLIINIKENLGEQFIVDKEQYKTKHPLRKG